MATLEVRYFNGSTRLTAIQPMRNAEFAQRFPGQRGRRYDGISMMVGRPVDGGELMPVQRSIDYKRFASKHVCSGKCLNGKVNGACECSCGGMNHGAGMFTSLMAA